MKSVMRHIVLTFAFVHGAFAGDLVISLSGIPNGKGHLRIALYNDEGRWGNDVEARKTLRSFLCVPGANKEGAALMRL